MTDTTRPDPDPAAAPGWLEPALHSSRSAPADRDLGRPVLDSPLVRGSMWLRWSGHDGIRTLHHGAGLARGWTERDETAYATAATIRAEWQRVRDHTAQTRAERYDPDHDTALQHALRAERHRQDVAECAREAAHQARQRSDATHRRLAGTTAQPLYTALERARLHTLTDDDHQAVRDLTHHLAPATLRQVMSWLERTRTAALALRGEQVPPTRPRARRSQF
ncbi:hypothetical protein GCM10010430_74110 [Kitasatospora cystarginea]|uniref:Uncharacterized protein n=1 Tax=Kitasatospora cystarginea TaxID=58350 RepID=A0ABN3EZH4_9ACTN